jgi:hypothetical protein
MLGQLLIKLNRITAIEARFAKMIFGIFNAG